MNESKSEQVAAGPNVNELEWAMEVVQQEDDAEQAARQQQQQGGQEDEGEALSGNEEEGEAQEQQQQQQQPEAGTSASSSSSSKKNKKKKGKAKSAMNKLKEKLSDPSPGTASQSQPDEQQVHALHSQLQAHVAKEHGQGAADKLTPDAVAQILQQAKLQDLRSQSQLTEQPSKKDIADYKFWSTQPVPKTSDEPIAQEGPIEADKSPEEIRQEPLPLPDSFEWATVDLNDPAQLQEVYELLTGHYVEDVDSSFRFDYSADFFRWALQPPGYLKEWHIGVRVSSSKKLVAFISGVPVNLRVRDITKYCSEINFLCIHKKLRSKRLAPVLIKEVTRRCHQAGVFQAIYTGGAYLPTPVARCQYYHRSLDTKKLVNLGFSGVPRHKTLAGMIRENALPTQTQLPGLREMREEDVRSVHTLLRAYLSRFEMSPLFDEAEVKHQFVSGQGTGEPVNGRRKGQVIWSYVVEDPSTKEITDFFSLYHLPSTAIRQNQTIDAAYMYYYATSAAGALTKQPTTSSDVPAASWSSESSSERLQLKKRLVALIGDALIVAKNARFDVFNALTLSDNSLFIHDLKFGAGDGHLHHYLYNWLARPIAGGTLAANQAAAAQGGAPEPTAGAAPPGMNVRECGSGVGIVML